MPSALNGKLMNLLLGLKPPNITEAFPVDSIAEIKSNPAIAIKIFFIIFSSFLLKHDLPHCATTLNIILTEIFCRFQRFLGVIGELDGVTICGCLWMMGQEGFLAASKLIGYAYQRVSLFK